MTCTHYSKSGWHRGYPWNWNPPYWCCYIWGILRWIHRIHHITVISPWKTVKSQADTPKSESRVHPSIWLAGRLSCKLASNSSKKKGELFQQFLWWTFWESAGLITIWSWFTMLHQQLGAVFQSTANPPSRNCRQPRFIEAIINGTSSWCDSPERKQIIDIFSLKILVMRKINTNTNTLYTYYTQWYTHILYRYNCKTHT